MFIHLAQSTVVFLIKLFMNVNKFKTLSNFQYYDSQLMMKILIIQLKSLTYQDPLIFDTY